MKHTEGTLAPHELYIQKVKDQEKRQKRNRSLFMALGVALVATVGIGYRMIPSTIEMPENEVFRSLAAEDLSVYEVNNYFKENKSPIIISYDGEIDPDTIFSVDDYVSILNSRAENNNKGLADNSTSEALVQSDSILAVEDKENQPVELIASSREVENHPQKKDTSAKSKTLGELIASYKESRNQVASKINSKTPKEQPSSNKSNPEVTPPQKIDKPSVPTVVPTKTKVDSVPKTNEITPESNPSKVPSRRRETEKRPSFIGGNNAMHQFILKEMNYPRKALDKGVKGNVFVTFVVNVEGEIVDAKVIKGIGYGCDKEALRLVQRMNRMWEPGHRNRKRLPMSFTLPVPFNLN